MRYWIFFLFAELVGLSSIQYGLYSIGINMNYLDQLTEIVLETDSELLISLCEHIRDLDIQESETWTLDSFIQWASNISGHNEKETNGEGEK